MTYIDDYYFWVINLNLLLFYMIFIVAIALKTSSLRSELLMELKNKRC